MYCPKIAVCVLSMWANPQSLLTQVKNLPRIKDEACKHPFKTIKMNSFE